MIEIISELITYRIIRAFLIEEQKIVVKVLKAQQAAEKAATVGEGGKKKKKSGKAKEWIFQVWNKTFSYHRLRPCGYQMAFRPTSIL